MPTITTPPDAGLVEWGDEDRRPAHGESSIALRVRVAVRRARLTQRLSEGADPSSSPELALRARQLVSDRERKILARTLKRTLEEARRPRLTGFSATVIRRGSVIEAVDPIQIMIDRLRDDRPVAAEGMALIERMITDGTWSPLYNTTVPGALRRLTVLATAALEPGPVAHGTFF
jgi:hypothetical protein